ncbi:MAG: TetR/AcrR family transcriptional regulator [Granulosicoccaceae bacterium]
MPTISRKQREIAQRHQLFLNIARDLINEEGCAALSMDRLAELGEYSRGTVYQHFPCKEEVLIEVCNSSMSYLLSLFERARAVPHSNRDRILAVMVAHNYFDMRQPHCNKILQYTSDNSIMDKVSEATLQIHNQLEKSLMQVVGSIVGDALKTKELMMPKNLSAIELVFGLWSLNLGSQLLQAAELHLEEIGITQPEETIARIVAATLDGLNWQPLHDAKKHKALMAWLKNTVFVGPLQADINNEMQLEKE